MVSSTLRRDQDVRQFSDSLKHIFWDKFLCSDQNFGANMQLGLNADQIIQLRSYWLLLENSQPIMNLNYSTKIRSVRGPFYYDRLTLILVWISNYIHYKVWGGIIIHSSFWSLGMDR